MLNLIGGRREFVEHQHRFDRPRSLAPWLPSDSEYAILEQAGSFVLESAGHEEIFATGDERHSRKAAFVAFLDVDGLKVCQAVGVRMNVAPPIDILDFSVQLVDVENRRIGVGARRGRKDEIDGIIKTRRH